MARWHERVNMNCGAFRKGLFAVLLMSSWVNSGRGALAQTLAPPVVTIVATDYHAAETETDSGVFKISRTGATEASLLVFYELSGTARNGVDYQELPRSITIPAGAASATITVKPINDSLVSSQSRKSDPPLTPS